MGICFSHLPFYDLCHSLGALQSPLFVLGSQEIHEPENEICEFAHRNGLLNLMDKIDVRSLLCDRFAIGISFTAGRDKLEALLAGEMTIANVLHMSAYCKMHEKEFRCPYDVQE